MQSYDVCIIGAGVVGCAIARELAQRRWDRSLRIVVLEAHERAGEETSARNSGVLHSGIHEHPGSLKSRLAREGSVLAVEYAVRRHIPLLRTGMVIAVAWDDLRQGLWRDLSSLWRLRLNAWKAQIPVHIVSPSGLRIMEPHLRALCGIVIPTIAVIDSDAFVHALKADAESGGVRFLFHNRVTAIEPRTDSYVVTTERQRLRAACLINAAGLHADEVAALAAPTRKYVISPLRGEYYEVVTESKKHLIRRLVYPALPPQSVGKGIHFSPRPNGQLFLGPNTVPVDSKTDYTSRKTPPGTFMQALQKFLPALEERDLLWAYSGIRPHVKASNGEKSDFIIAADCEDPPLINVVGIESPGLSAALGIAGHVVETPCLRRRFHMSGGAPSSSHAVLDR